MGFFDPLTALQAKRLAEAATGGRKILAIVLDKPDSLLSVDARAALVAAVRHVGAVVIAEPHDWRSVLPGDADIEILDDLEADKKRSEQFVEFVFTRQKAGQCPSS